MNTPRKVTRTRDIMTDEFAMIDGLITVKEALKVFKERGAKVLIIDKRHEDDEYGLLLLSAHAPVIEAGKVLGVVNYHNIVLKGLLEN